jgi:xanthine/CO dehydrogenase XdhC/CoxF family maturation factor
MTDLEQILPLWHELEAAGADYVLATIVEVQGSSYRKPGARMLLTQDGRRAGTVSGGCLEAEVARRAWWLTAGGPRVERYSTLEDDGDLPYGSGCGGVVFILLERRATASPLLTALEVAFEARNALAVATVLSGPDIGQRAYSAASHASLLRHDLQLAADAALQRRANFERQIQNTNAHARIFAEYCPARPGLWIFGAGDDAKPLLALARTLGWYVAIADGRSHLVTQARFPLADECIVLPIAELPETAPAHFRPHPTDAAVLLTHSFEQDAHILASLLSDSRESSDRVLSCPLAYIGVLGPQRRTRELLAECARLLGLSATEDRIECWLAQLHAPVGIDLGADTPATIALSILAEIQQTLTDATALPLKVVRAVSPAAARN